MSFLRVIIVDDVIDADVIETYDIDADVFDIVADVIDADVIAVDIIGRSLEIIITEVI